MTTNDAGANGPTAARINPYISAFRLAANRLRWDLSPESFRSRSRLRGMRDIHAGRKAVILCNGPSLLKVDFDAIERSGVFTFGLNKINLLFEKHSFRPSAIVAINRFVLDQNATFYNQTSIPLFLDSYGHRLVRSRDNVTFLHTATVISFAEDCSISINPGYTVTFAALQLAFHMGFSEVALVGCDHNFAQKGQANAVVVAGEKDASHFDPNYFAGGVQWQLPDLVNSESSYQTAGYAYQNAGRRIFNCTDGGLLEIYPRRELTDFLGA